VNRYQYICIEGNIGAGKTTLTRMLGHAWDGYPIFEQFTDNPFLPLFYNDKERYGFQVELFFMTERHKQLEQIAPKTDLFRQLYVGDYFFQKTLVFAGKTLSPEDYRLFKRLFDILEKNAPTPDLLVYLHQSVDQVYENIKKRGRSMEDEISKDYLQIVQDAYFEYFRQITHFPILILEMDGMDFENETRDFEMIKRAIDQDYRPGVNRMSF
jgi:deoxyadenosine/deoxycytidine kinase